MTAFGLDHAAHSLDWHHVPPVACGLGALSCDRAPAKGVSALDEDHLEGSSARSSRGSGSLRNVPSTAPSLRRSRLVALAATRC